MLPTVPAGTAVPADALHSATSTVSLTIGGMKAPVQFAGLTPGSAGLYQMNLVVPSGLPSGTAVPLVVNIGAAFSPPVTVAVK